MLKHKIIENTVLLILVIMCFLFFYKVYPFILDFFYGLFYSEIVEEMIRQNVKKECLK
jgi:hypothetical protein